VVLLLQALKKAKKTKAARGIDILRIKEGFVERLTKITGFYCPGVGVPGKCPERIVKIK